MLEVRTRIADLVERLAIPAHPSEVFSGMLSGDGLHFVAQETTLWDYKEIFPATFRDDYAGGILRLTCAFHNSYGGLILFGVRDSDRSAGHNSTIIDIERFNTLLRQKLSASIECQHRKFGIGAEGNSAVDVILVPKRHINSPPVYFGESIGKYPKERIYLRRGHEVLEARSADIPFLYGSRQYSRDAQVDDTDRRVVRGLPPSSSTIREFVGRMRALERLWRWLSDPDEPRCFLYGKGGSGKSTIAYEFARMVADSAESLSDSNNRGFDAVIYLTAKKRQLLPETGKVAEFPNCDFETSKDLFRKILIVSEWNSQPQELSDDELIREVGQLLNEFRVLMVFDDIDTLTTGGIDPGMDPLFVLLARARTTSKVLYTMRNLPSQSRSNSIEVPGLDADSEYPEFIAKCCSQFGVVPPSLELIKGRISDLSERRPLVVETIVALRRTCGTYEATLEIFKNQGGDETRSYLFDREYNAFKSDNNPRYLLAAISLFPSPVKFADLENVLQMGGQEVRDAIGQVNEMFLAISTNEKTGETLYGIGQATRSYIENQRHRLDRFPKLRETVNAYRRREHPVDRELVQLIRTIDRYLREKDVARADADLRAITDAKVTQHPMFRVLVGRVATSHSPPEYDVAREAFLYAVKMRYIDIEAMRTWYFLERTSGRGLQSAAEVCDYVLNGKDVSPIFKSEFLGKKGYVVLKAAEHEIGADPEDGLARFREATLLNLQSATLAFRLRGTFTDKTWDWCKSCFDIYTSNATRLNRGASIIEFLEATEGLYLDPIVDSIVSLVRQLEAPHQAHAGRNRAVLQRLQDFLVGASPPCFDDVVRRDRMMYCIESAISSLSS